MAGINLRQVEAFRAVMLSGSVTAAAKLMGVTQPAVSRLLRDFQLVLKMPLFEKRGTGLVPTAAATALYTEVERSFSVSTASPLRRRKSEHAAPGCCASRLCRRCPTASCRASRAISQGPTEPELIFLWRDLATRRRLGDEPPVRPRLRRGADGPCRPSDRAHADAAACCNSPSGHRLCAKAMLRPRDFEGETFISLTPGAAAGT